MKIATILIVLLVAAGCDNRAQEAIKTRTDLVVDAPPQVSERKVKGCELQHVAPLVISAIRDRDFVALAELVHPQRGVRFSPYATVNIETDRHYESDSLALAATDKQTVRWGFYDGSGDPIDMSFAAYFDRFVYDRDFAALTHWAINKRVGQGNSIDNIAETYPDGHYVEYYVAGVHPDYGGMDWASLRLVFSAHDGCARLVGVVHDQWTS